MSCIVTDARYRMSLAVIRSLGRAGVRVIAQEEAGVSSLDALGFHSRYASERVLTASPRSRPRSFVDDLMRVGEKGDVLIPVSLSGILAVLERVDEVKTRFRLALPSCAAVRTANDTGELLAVAERIGLRVPRTLVFGPGEDPSGVFGQLAFPVVVKYREGEGLGLPPARRYAIVRQEESFLPIYRKMAAIQASPLVQEYVSGDGWGMSAVMNASSDPVAVFCHRRLREYPVTGGPSSFCESVHDAELVERGIRLLTELRWHGVAMVEFKRDFVSGEFVLMEVNPRFWGSLPLAIASGVDFPHILYRVANGEDLRPVAGYRAGVRMRYLFQDLLSVPGYLRRVPNRWRFLGSFARDLLDTRVVDGVFQMNDPVPGIYYLGRALLRAGHKSDA